MNKIEYMLLGSLSNNERNVEVLSIDSLEKCIKAKKLLESINEHGYFCEMKNQDKILKILNKLEKLNIFLYDDHGMFEPVPEIESLRIIETHSID